MPIIAQTTLMNMSNNWHIWVMTKEQNSARLCKSTRCFSPEAWARWTWNRCALRCSRMPHRIMPGHFQFPNLLKRQQRRKWRDSHASECSKRATIASGQLQPLFNPKRRVMFEFWRISADWTQCYDENRFHYQKSRTYCNSWAVLNMPPQST